MAIYSPPRHTIPAWPWIQPPPGAGPFDGAITPGPRFNPMVGHSHVYANQPYPGAPAFAYENLGLVEFSVIGPAVVNRMQLRHLQPPPWNAGLAIPMQGLGGLVSGQIISASLTIPLELQQAPLGDPIAAGMAPGY